MKFGDFFEKAPHAQPVNPGPVKFTCVAKGPVLPGEHENPSGRMVKARCEACFIYLDADEISKITAASRKALNERKDADGRPVPYTDDDLIFEAMYRELQQSVREYDKAKKTAGGPFFEQVNTIRQHLIPTECRRVHRLWTAYLEAEHGEVADAATKSGAPGGGQGVAPPPPV